LLAGEDCSFLHEKGKNRSNKSRFQIATEVTRKAGGTDSTLFQGRKKKVAAPPNMEGRKEGRTAALSKTKEVFKNERRGNSIPVRN